jgi:hypothetical protein
MTDLPAFRTRLLTRLGDPSGGLYSTALLDESVRHALDCLNFAAGEPGWEVAGLDEAAETSLPRTHHDTLLSGAAGYAVLTRALERVDRVELRPETSLELYTWALEQLNGFWRALEGVAARAHAGSLPYDAAGWSFD